MKTITEQDKDKRYFLDTDRTNEVKLIAILHDDWVEIGYPDGRKLNVVIARLTEITEVPRLEKITDDILEYPIKATRVEIQYTNDKGELSVKFLDGKDAVTWNQWVRELCFKAEEIGMNPHWLSLQWKTKDGKSS